MNKSTLISRAADITVKYGDQDVTLFTKDQIVAFIEKMYNAEYVNRSQAKKLTKLSYLGSVNSSSKISKGLKKDYNTYILYLSPYKNIFGNVCPMAITCVDSCLDTSGRVKMDIKDFKIQKARTLKTLLFYINRNYFNAWLFDEIKAANNLHGEGKFDYFDSMNGLHTAARRPNFMVRLNGTSDLSPKLFAVNGVNILDAFPGVQFYDYTKVFNRLDLDYHNYHITFSYDGTNMDQCILALNMGVNVSIVVNGEMPESYNNVPVFSMDETDLRPLDESEGHFGYLKLKETLNKNYDSTFIINL